MSEVTTPLRIGLIGDDLGTSLSPAIHQAEAAALGLGTYSYESIDLAGIPEPDLREILARGLAEGFTGFNVTHPYKQAIMAHLDSLDPTATALGAVNTVVVGPHGLTGHNTDHSGFLSGLRRTLPADERHDAVVLFGAGGAGSAVAAALLDFGVRELRIIDTDLGRLGRLRESLNRAHPTGGGVRVETGSPGMAREWIGAADGVVNATPIGMSGMGGTPFDTAWLESSHWVADVVYRPVLTELLSAALHQGCRVVNGTTMLIEQAADTFALVTGVEPDRVRMRSQLDGLLAALAA